MSVEQRWWVRCSQCGTRGPEQFTSPEARALAGKEGWMVGTVRQNAGQGGSKVRDKDDYCPECRVNHEQRICGFETQPGAGKCGGRGVYAITADDNAEYTTCGKHLLPFLHQLRYAKRLPVSLDEVHNG